jgi:hypothetical protein
VPIYARAVLPDPDGDDVRVHIDRIFRDEEEFDRWVDVAPEAIAAVIILSDDKPIPSERSSWRAPRSRQRSTTH